MLARVTGSGSASASAGASETNRKAEAAGHDASPIPGAWNEGSGGEDGGAARLPPPASAKSAHAQPPELAAIAAGAKNGSAVNLGDTEKVDEDGWLLD